MAHRRQLVKHRTRLKNHLHSLLHRHQLAVVDGDPFAEKNRAWWDGLKVSPVERLHLRHDLKGLAAIGSGPPPTARNPSAIGRRKNGRGQPGADASRAPGREMMAEGTMAHAPE